MVRLSSLRQLGVALASVLILGACGAPAATPATADTSAATAEAVAVEAPAEAPAEETTPHDDSMAGDMTAEAAMADETMAGETMADETMGDETMADEAAVERPAWQSMALTDARSGATFTLADFAGKTVFVEPFATWCSNCRQKLANVHAARQVAGEDVVFVVLSVEANIGNEALAAYAADTGYDLMFAAMPPEMLQALAAQFGQTIANPPATPHFVIAPDGSTGELVTGIESTEALLAQVGVRG
jgi:thiol-disulfide isomerase/thioredoxin